MTSKEGLCPTLVFLAFACVGCARPVVPKPAAPPTPAVPSPAAQGAVPVAAPLVLTTYPFYQPLPAGQQTAPQAAAQGRVSLDDYFFHVNPDGAGGSVLDGSVSVHNHGPYNITDFQVSLREAGRLYFLILRGLGHRIGPAQATVYTVRAAVPLPPDQLKTGKSFFLEAQLDGPPGLATDEESGTTIVNTPPGPPR